MTQTWTPIDHCTCASDDDWCAYCTLTERAITAYLDARAEA